MKFANKAYLNSRPWSADHAPAYAVLKGDEIMSPDKVKTIRGHKIEQFYWAGRNVVYIDNRLTDWKYDEITSETIALASAEKQA